LNDIYEQYEVEGVLPKWVEEFKRCEKWISDALEYSHGTHNLEDLLHDVANGNLSLWAGEDCALIMQITQYPRAKMAHCFLAGGNIEGIAAIEVGITAWAKGLGCNGITLMGRPGWARSFLSKIGYDCRQVNMVKEF